MRLLLVSLVVLVCSIASIDSFAHNGRPPPRDRYALYADFDNKVPGDPISARGGVFGEPAELGNLNTQVFEVAPGNNALRVSSSTNRPRPLVWKLLGGAEIETGEVKISFEIIPSALDNYRIQVREGSGSSRLFLTLELTDTGSLTASDANGAIVTVPFVYAAGDPLPIELDFDMTARTSSIHVNGLPISTARAFGVTDRGIGRLTMGYDKNSSGSAFDLDHIRVSGTLPFAVALEADFNSKTPGTDIGLGGAENDEPMAMTSGLDTKIMADGPSNNFLEMARSNTTVIQSLRWQFLSDMEISSGLVIMDFDMGMTTRDHYSLAIRVPFAYSKRFLDLTFLPSGMIYASDESSPVATMLEATYDADVMYKYRLIFNLDAATYDIFRDGEPLLRERSNGVTTRGIGSLLNYIHHDALNTAHLQFDSLRVYSTDLIYIDGFDRAAQ